MVYTKKVPVHLEKRLRSFAYYKDDKLLTKEKLHHLLVQRIETLGVDQAKEDIVKFIKDPQTLESWNQSVFY